MNDAVAIVTTRSLEDYETKQLETHDKSAAFTAILMAILYFVFVFGASFLVGSIIAIINALLTKFTKIKDLPQLESSLLILMSYSSYLLAEMLSLRGL